MICKSKKCKAKIIDGKKFEISPGERRSAFKKHKFYAPTEDEEKDNLLYTNTMLNLEQSKSVHVTLSRSCEEGATTAALFSGVTSHGGGGGLDGQSQGGPGVVGDVGGVSCTRKSYDYDDSVYLL